MIMGNAEASLLKFFMLIYDPNDDDMIQNNDKIICRQFYISNAFFFLRSTDSRLFSHQYFFPLLSVVNSFYHHF